VDFFWNSAMMCGKIDHDEKAALYLNAILKFNFLIALLVAEHILSSTVALTNYLQKRDIDLLEAVRTTSLLESNVVTPLVAVTFIGGFLLELCNDVRQTSGFLLELYNDVRQVDFIYKNVTSIF
jgi:hypothetical protein